MTTTELLKFHEDFCEKARNIMASKNHDYAGKSGDTPFANFQAAERLNITSTERGFMVRMLDKMMRLATFADGGKLQVANEGAYDACMDIVNYSILLAAYLKQQQEADHECDKGAGQPKPIVASSNR
jgi:hypothetical protein